MRRWVASVIFAVGMVGIVAHAQDDAAVAKDLDAIHGKWKVTRCETPEGQKDDLIGIVFTFDKKEKTIQFEVNGNEKKGKFALNPAGKPKELTFTPQSENQDIAAIYALEKDMLKLCAATRPGDARPTEFRSGAGTETILLTLERVK